MAVSSTRPVRTTPGVWTAWLARTVAIASVVFTLGTAAHNFAIIDEPMIEELMRRAGGADPAGDAPGFTRGFRTVGTLYIVGNALGILAWWYRPTWLFWVVLLVNATQGLGWVMIPAEMWSVALERYGWVGVLPSGVVDGGGALLAIVMIATLVLRWRTRGEAGGTA